VTVRGAGTSDGTGTSTAGGRVVVRAAGTSAATSTDTAAAQGSVAGIPIVTVSMSHPRITHSTGGQG
jgi:hypothetical protein